MSVENARSDSPSKPLSGHQWPHGTAFAISASHVGDFLNVRLLTVEANVAVIERTYSIDRRRPWSAIVDELSASASQIIYEWLTAELSAQLEWKFPEAT